MSTPPNCLPESSERHQPIKFYRPFKRCEISEKYVPYCHTTSQAEVFQIVIDKFDETERPGEVYGKIEVVDIEGCLTLYQRHSGNPEQITANSTLSLIGFPRSICNLTGFGVSIDLRLRGSCGEGGNGDDSDDAVLGKWQFSWDIVQPGISRITCMGMGYSQYIRDQHFDPKHQMAGFDRPLCVNFEGPNGCCISMYYALFKYAVQAWVQVEIVHMTDAFINLEFDARGAIATTYSQFECGNDSDFKDRCKTMLLKTKDMESVKIKNGKKIQLSRSVIAVPLYAYLVVEADLSSNTGFKIAQGNVKFLPDQCNIAKDYIRGDGDVAIRVMVAWSYGSRIPRRNPF